MTPPNVLFVMTDQERYDTIAALGNPHIYTPNLDRLVQGGVAFTNAYSTCPVCVPARYTVRTGCEPLRTDMFTNSCGWREQESVETMESRLGPFLARRMRQLGYRTFGIGKFHVEPWDRDLGFDLHLHSEELYGDPDQRRRDAFARFIRERHPEYDWIEMLQGERTEMYYMPQMSPLPAALTVESWAADRAVEAMAADDGRPFFGFLSFVGPHPPLAPPLPFNRMYDPDRMVNPILGNLQVDHADEQIPFMNYAIWAEDISDATARILKARYYGEISYIDQCLGRVLDALEDRPDATDTLVAFFSDHGDHLGDHHAWQKESFFEASCRVPFVVRWPARLTGGGRRDDLVCLTDLFGLATGAAGRAEPRDGIDLLGLLAGRSAPRRTLFGCYGRPGTPLFKAMARQGPWKYIFLANGGREQLFNLAEDPMELDERSGREPGVVEALRSEAVAALAGAAGAPALDSAHLRAFPFAPRPLRRIYQFDASRAVCGFPARPEDVLKPRPDEGSG